MTDDAGLDTLGDDMRIFVDRVRQETALERTVDAEVLARATLRALGEQIPAEAAGHLTASLPEELVAEITAHAASGPDSFDHAAFLDQVAGELGTDSDADTDRATLDRRVHAVLSVLREWSPPGQLEDTLARLPKELAAMFA